MSQLDQFVSKLGARRIKVIISASKKQRECIVKKLGKNPEGLIDDFLKLREQTGVGRFSFVLERSKPVAWKKKGGGWAVINFSKISDKSNRKGELRTVLNDLAGIIMSAEEGALAGKEPPSKAAPEKILATEDLLLELGEGIQVLVPSAKALNLRVDKGEGFLYLRRGTAPPVSLFIHFFNGREGQLPEITIAGKTYRLKEQTLAELREGEGAFDFVDGLLVRKEIPDRQFPLIKRNGIKIISLAAIRGNVAVTEILT